MCRRIVNKSIENMISWCTSWIGCIPTTRQFQPQSHFPFSTQTLPFFFAGVVVVAGDWLRIASVCHLSLETHHQLMISLNVFRRALNWLESPVSRNLWQCVCVCSLFFCRYFYNDSYLDSTANFNEEWALWCGTVGLCTEPHNIHFSIK